MKLKKSTARILGIALSLVMMIMLAVPVGVFAGLGEPGTAPSQPSGPVRVQPMSQPLTAQVTETGKISLSIDGLGTLTSSGIIQVEKPAGATVRKAYMAAATTGFTGYALTAGDVKIDGNNFVWSMTTSSSVSSFNYWGDVTSIVKSKIDAAAAGRVDFTITEANTGGIDGEILAVIFDDPNQTVTNTVVLLFGAQNVAGDTFNIGLGTALDKSDPNLKLDMSLGISYSYQNVGVQQYSIVNVDGHRMTTSAGGEDDGDHANGALLTVGGLDDSNANPPDPNATPANFRSDDELYSLLPFVNTGDTSIVVYTKNPSNDDNIFFSGLFLGSAIAVVGEGIVLGPATATNYVGSPHTVTATVQDANGNPVVGRNVTFDIISGPNVGMTSTSATDSNGKAKFTYTGTSVGTDVIVASFIDSKQQKQTSAEVTKEWKDNTTIPPTTNTEVGGDIYSVSKTGLLIPLIATALILVAGITIVVWRRRAHN